MNKFLLSACLMVLVFGLSAQETKTDTTYWTKGGFINLNFSQTNLNNWAGGGENAVAFNGIGRYFINFKKGDQIWDNTLDLGYGLLKQGEGSFIKSDDKLEINSKFGSKIDDSWMYAALLTFKTQMAIGYDNASNEAERVMISNFMAPAFNTLSIGFEYKANDAATCFISPLTSKTTFVLDDNLAAVAAFGVDTGWHHRAEIGGFVRFAYNKTINEKTQLIGRVDLFSNYTENSQDIDVISELLITTKINKYLGVTFNFNLLFDKDIDIPVDDNNDGIPEEYTNLQTKNVFGAGIIYQF